MRHPTGDEDEEGGLLVLEVTDDFSLFSRSQVPPEEEGIYVVRADGSGLRRLGPPSRAPCFVPLGSTNPYFAFSPDGRTVTFTDLDPDVPRLDAPQIVTLDLLTGQRRQLTHLPPAAPPATQHSSWLPYFLNAETVVFTSYANPSTEDYPQGANPDRSAVYGVRLRFLRNGGGLGATSDIKRLWQLPRLSGLSAGLSAYPRCCK